LWSQSADEEGLRPPVRTKALMVCRSHSRAAATRCRPEPGLWCQSLGLGGRDEVGGTPLARQSLALASQSEILPRMHSSGPRRDAHPTHLVHPLPDDGVESTEPPEPPAPRRRKLPIIL